MIEIQFDDSPDQTFDIQTNEGVLSIRLRYNVVMSRWTCEVSINQEAITSGSKVLLNTDLIHKPLKYGRLFAINHLNNDQPDRLNVINERFEGGRNIYLYYMSVDEVQGSNEQLAAMP